jgi:hypothetical protein
MNNLANGIGIYKDEKEEYLYEGEWSQDQPHGKGAETFKFGSHYEGEFHNGKKEGIGKYISSSGASYEG